MQPTNRDAAAHGAGRQPEAGDLRERDDAVLASRELGQPLIEGVLRVASTIWTRSE